MKRILESRIIFIIFFALMISFLCIQCSQTRIENINCEFNRNEISKDSIDILITRINKLLIESDSNYYFYQNDEFDFIIKVSDLRKYSFDPQNIDFKNFIIMGTPEDDDIGLVLNTLNNESNIDVIFNSSKIETDHIRISINNYEDAKIIGKDLCRLTYIYING